MVTTTELGLEPERNGERTEGASLSEADIRRGVEKGEIDLKEMTIAERERYRSFAPLSKRG